MSLARVDVLPGGCSIIADFGEEFGVRFVAVDSDGRRSEPSGWFDQRHAPIHLNWVAFDFGDDD